MRLYRPIFLSGLIWPEMIFRIKAEVKELCLTFDDGPDPDLTPSVLDLLGERNVNALFFCAGIKAEKYPRLRERIISEGHKVGNHGYFHLDGWRTSRKDYIENVERAAGLTSGNLFRPPYGRLKLSQYHDLRGRYRIIGWDLMPYDFDINMGRGKMLEILEKKIRPGSIVVLHDAVGSLAPSILGEFIDRTQ